MPLTSVAFWIGEKETGDPKGEPKMSTAGGDRLTTVTGEWKPADASGPRHPAVLPRHHSRSGALLLDLAEEHPGAPLAIAPVRSDPSTALIPESIRKAESIRKWQ